MIPGIPYWRLSAFYFCYFAVLGALVPYWPVYLRAQGLTPEGIGILNGIIYLARSIAPNFWGWLADRTAQRMRIVQVGAFCSALSFATLYVGKSVLWLAIVISAYSFFWNALLAQFEVVTFNYLGAQPHAYTRIRVWGSVGFIVSATAVGILLDLSSIRILPAYLLVAMGVVWLGSLPVRDVPSQTVRRSGGDTVWPVLKQPVVACFFVVCFLMQVSHGPYYTFFSLYMEKHHHSGTVTGQLWTVGVVAEVVLFWFMVRLLPRFGLRRLMLASLLLASVRWALLALFPDVLAIVLLAQCLHAFSFGSFHATAIEFVRRFFPEHQSGRGQALYNSLGYGIGTALGAFFSGYLWDWSNRWTFLAASAVSFVGFVVAWRGLHLERLQGAEDGAAGTA